MSNLPSAASVLRGLAACVVGVLALRGATAFYVQYWGGAQPAPAATAPTPPRAAIPSKAQRLERASQLVGGMGKQGQVSDVFSAADGTTGVIIRSGEGAFVGWMVDGVDALFVGAKFDAAGQNLTQQEMLARRLATPSAAPPAAATQTSAAPAPARSVLDARGLLQAVSQSPGFVEGASGPIVTAYVDANCTFCTQLWRNLRAPIAAGRIRVRWAPVAVLGETSSGKAATLLQAPNALDLMANHGISGAAIAASPVSAAAQLQIDANNAMLRTLSGGQAPATPTLVVPRASGEPMIVRGLPPDVAEVLRQAGV